MTDSPNKRDDPYAAKAREIAEAAHQDWKDTCADGRGQFGDTIPVRKDYLVESITGALRAVAEEARVSERKVIGKQLNGIRVDARGGLGKLAHLTMRLLDGRAAAQGGE